MNEEEKYLLNTRTKEALSSYISENYFHKNFKMDKINHTTGWWISKTRDNRYIIFLVKDIINELDFEVIGKMKNVVSGIYQLKLTDSGMILTDLLQQPNIDFSLEQFLKLWNHHNSKGAIEHKENSEIKNSYWEYFKNEKIEYKVIKQIKIENQFLKKYFYSTNIDYILKNNIGILLLEIKYKYPSRNKTYGINSMQYDVYSLFQGQGMIAFNVVLENVQRIDILKRQNGSQVWKYSRIKQNLTEKKYAPKETSYDQNGKQGYYELQASNYHRLNYDSNIFNLVCPKCKGNLIKKNGKYGEFLGCINYLESDCKGSLSL